MGIFTLYSRWFRIGRWFSCISFNEERYGCELFRHRRQSQNVMGKFVENSTNACRCLRVTSLFHDRNVVAFCLRLVSLKDESPGNEQAAPVWSLQKPWTFSRCFRLHAWHSGRITAACTQFLCSRFIRRRRKIFRHPCGRLVSQDAMREVSAIKGTGACGSTSSGFPLTVVLRSELQRDQRRLLWILTLVPLTDRPGRLLHPHACNYLGPETLKRS